MTKLRWQYLNHLLVGFALRHPFVVIGGALLGVVLSLLLSMTRLEFRTDRLDLVSSGNRYKQLDQAHSREFEDVAQGVIAVIRSPDPERAKAFATALAKRWQADPSIERVLYRIPFEALQNKALYYLAPDALEALRDRLQQWQGMLDEFVAQPTLQNLFALINRQITQALVSHVFTDGFADDEAGAAVDLTLLRALVQQLHQRLDQPQPFQSPWETLFLPDGEGSRHDGFLWSEDRRLLFVLANPRTDAGDFNRFRTAVQQIRRDVQELRQSYPEVEVGITGKAILESDEMAAAQWDMAVTTLISLAGVALLYIVFFRGVVRPTLAVITLVIGLAWSMGFTTLAVGHLNIFTVVFAPMLIGMGIDYGIHLLTRYEAERAAGRDVRRALERTFVDTGPGIITAALTMAAAFYALTLTDFLGLRELGFITGSGLLLILLLTFMVLPALLALDERWRARRPAPRRGPQRTDRSGYLEPLYRYPWATLIASACGIGLSCLAVGKVGTDFNLLRLQSERTESVIWARQIFASAKHSLLNGELMAASLAEVERKATALSRLPSVERVDSVLSALPKDQEAKRQRLSELRPLLADVALQGAPAEGFDLEALRSALQRIAAKLGDDEPPSASSTPQQLHEVRQLIAAFLQRTALPDKAEVQRALAALQSDLLADLGAKLAVLRQNAWAEPVTPDDLPAELRARYVGKTGKFRLFVFPAEDIWDHQALARFVTDLTAVDADAIGAPVTNFAYIQAIEKGYETAGLLALIGIVLLTFLTFRAVRPTLLALIPLTVGAAWTFGLMALFQVQFNLANIIAIPLIIGISVDSGILVVHRFWVEQEHGEAVSPLIHSTGKAITLSSLTEIVGFASLLMANHRGIYSLGLLVTLGLGSVLIASVTTLPSLLAVLGARSRKTVARAGRMWQSASGEAD